MSRFVQAFPVGLKAKAAAASRGSTPGREYLERVAKYIPAEIIATYTAVNGTLASLPVALKYWFLLGNLVICWAFTPIYLKLLAMPKDKPSLRTQQIMSTIAFPIWAYSVSGDKGFFGGELHIYFEGAASAFILLFSLISGAVIPRIKPITALAKPGK